MKYLQNIITATALLTSISVGATIKTIDTDSFGKTIFIDLESKEVISIGTGMYGNNVVNGTKEEATPYALGIGNAVSVIAAGGRQFILRADGTVWMVDRPINYLDKEFKKLTLLSIEDVSDIEANFNDAYFIVDGSVYKMNITNNGTPELVEGLPNNIIEISVSFYHSVARTANGQVYAWGKNTQGQLGDGTNTDRPIPQVIEGLPAIKAISTANYNTVLTDVSGNVWAMGEGRTGRLGNGTDFDEWSPVKLPINNPQTVAKGYAGNMHTMVLFIDSHVEMIGWHNYIGYGAYNLSYDLFVAPELIDIKELDITNYNMFIKHDGSVIGWGGNNQGQLGNGLYTETHTPGQILPIIWPDNYVIEEPIDNTISNELPDNGNQGSELSCEPKIVEVEVIKEIEVIKTVEIIKEIEVELSSLSYKELKSLIKESKAILKTLDHDKGHGNDADGIDEDNPGERATNKKTNPKN